jgi:hypothetical protein
MKKPHIRARAGKAGGPPKLRGKRTPGPVHDLAVELESRGQARANAWEVIAAQLAEFVEQSDILAASSILERGGVTLLDLQGIEFAEFMWLARLQRSAVEAMEAGGRTGNLVGTLASVRLASRKNMRTLAALMNPTHDESSTHPTVPAEIASLYNAEAYGADDLGDELLS